MSYVVIEPILWVQVITVAIDIFATTATTATKGEDGAMLFS
jgi:hypothetical protein